MRSGEAGYTMLELITTIAIIGILAATAAPKFVNTSTAARASTLTGLKLTLDTANKFIYARAASAGLLARAGNAGCVGGTASPPITGPFVNMGNSVQPTYICTAYGFASNATELARHIDLGDIVINGNRFEHAEATNGALCEITYTPATDSATAPVYVVDTTDCS